MNQRWIVVALISFASLASAAPARAQRAPDTATLDRGDGIVKLGFDVGYVALDAPPYDGAMRLELHGQYVTSSGLGLYGALPLSLSFGDDDDPPGDQDDAAIGNLDLGLLYVLSGSAVSWVFRGGVALPTADESVDGALTNAVAVWPRLTDYVLAAPDAAYARFGISPLIHAERLFVRFDLGIDVGIDEGPHPDAVARLNAGAGYDFGPLALSLELASLACLDDGLDEDFIHTLAFTMRFMTERLEPFISIGAPLDDSARGAVDFFVSGGIQFPL